MIPFSTMRGRSICATCLPRQVEALPFDEPQGNSLTEAQTVVRACRELGVRALVIVSPAFHLPRALLTALSVAEREYSGLRVYAHPGGRAAGWWDEEVAHSQGVVRGVRAALCTGEVERIRIYSAKGDIVAPARALELLLRRDERTEYT